jgi:hypothetical protein
LLAAVGCAPQARDPADELAHDALLFSVPWWCGREGKRRPWTEWAVERGRAPTGTGVCGTDLPNDDAGMCLEIKDGAVARAAVRGGDAGREVAGLAGHAVEEGWIASRVGGRAVEIRIVDDGVEARDGEVVTRGPCFWR